MKVERIKGLGTALVTPFTEQGGLDYIALERLLRMQQDAEVDYVVVLGTTGEKATLDAEEIESIQDNIIAYYNTQVPLVIGFGGNNTAEMCKTLHDLSYSPLEHCFDAMLSVCPYYVKPTQEGLYQHFMALHEKSPWPIILYNVPVTHADQLLDLLHVAAGLFDTDNSAFAVLPQTHCRFRQHVHARASGYII